MKRFIWLTWIVASTATVISLTSPASDACMVSPSIVNCALAPNNLVLYAVLAFNLLTFYLVFRKEIKNFLSD